MGQTHQGVNYSQLMWALTHDSAVLELFTVTACCISICMLQLKKQKTDSSPIIQVRKYFYTSMLCGSQIFRALSHLPRLVVRLISTVKTFLGWFGLLDKIQ